MTHKGICGGLGEEVHVRGQLLILTAYVDLFGSNQFDFVAFLLLF